MKGRLFVRPSGSVSKVFFETGGSSSGAGQSYQSLLLMERVSFVVDISSSDCQRKGHLYVRKMFIFGTVRLTPKSHQRETVIDASRKQ